MPVDPPEPPVRRVIARLVELMEGEPSDEDVTDVLAAVDALGDSDIVRFDEQARSWVQGRLTFDRNRFERSRWRPRRARPRDRLQPLLDLVSADGYRRERGVRDCPLRPATVGLLAVRTTDWVPQVSEAALARMEHVPAAALADRLELLERLTQRWARGSRFDALVERRLDHDALWSATAAADPAVRRAAWRRLAARGTGDPRELVTRAVADSEAVIRAVGASLLPRLEPADRRAAAATLLRDPVGSIAARGLEALVELDGEPAILTALTARSPTLRRHARAWAAVRGVDARAVYFDRLRIYPFDAMALVALAELGHPADERLIVDSLGDPRTRVRAAALRAVARFDEQAARRAAVDELVSGEQTRPIRAAAAVLRGSPLSVTDLPLVSAVALDAERPDSHRLIALALLRPTRWHHLSAVLRARLTAEGSLAAALDADLRGWLAANFSRGGGPDTEQREVIAGLLPGLDRAPRAAIEFMLRTS